VRRRRSKPENAQCDPNKRSVNVAEAHNTATELGTLLTRCLLVMSKVMHFNTFRVPSASICANRVQKRTRVVVESEKD